LKSKKEVLKQIEKTNLSYGIKGEEHLIGLFEKLAADYKLDDKSKETATFLKEYFNMRKDDIEKYTALIKEVGYFGLKDTFEIANNVLVPDVLFEQFQEKLNDSQAKTIFIPECEKQTDSLLNLIQENPTKDFTLSFLNKRLYEIADYLFKDYSNVTCIEASIYEYEFTNKKFDYIFAVPALGVREKVKSEEFISRQHDLVALENLLLHLNPNGNLFIVLAAGFTFGGGDKQNLRRFILDMYSIEEISELPDETFRPYSSVKTYFMVFTNKNLDEIVLKKYKCTRTSRNGACISMATMQEDLFFKTELEEKSTWNIDIINAENDEELQRYITSKHKKVALKDYAEIFRGRSVSKKDPNGNIGVINIADIDELGINYSQLDYIEESERKISRYLLEDGDVLISSRGTILKTAVFKEQTYPCISSSNLIVIRPSEGLLGDYLKIFFESTIGVKLLKSIQRGTTVVNINFKDLGPLEIPLLPLQEQREIVRKYESEMDEYKNTIQEAEKRWENAKKCILEKIL